MDPIFIIAVIVLAGLGALMFFAPKACTRADKRDDPDSVAQIKKFGTVLMLAAVGALLYMIKFTTR
ncbi:MAG: hypothetical protein IJ746_06785 [Ruminococcus sp.]|nr:hypothetical protein [Ruminococcus sp.]